MADTPTDNPDSSLTKPTPDSKSKEKRMAEKDKVRREKIEAEKDNVRMDIDKTEITRDTLPPPPPPEPKDDGDDSN